MFIICNVVSGNYILMYRGFITILRKPIGIWGTNAGGSGFLRKGYVRGTRGSMSILIVGEGWNLQVVPVHWDLKDNWSVKGYSREKPLGVDKEILLFFRQSINPKV